MIKGINIGLDAATISKIVRILGILGPFIVGLIIYRLSLSEEKKHFQSTNPLSWMFIALSSVLVIFSFLTKSEVSLTIKGISATGGLAALLIIWWCGVTWGRQGSNIDELNAEIAKLKSDLQKVNEENLLLKKIQEQAQSQSDLTLTNSETFCYKVNGTKGKKIALITGDISKVTKADIWVNSENTNMQMARFYESSISGTIRYYGAKRDEMGYVINDCIAEELARQMATGGHKPVYPAKVLVTEPGELQNTNKVKKIFHVASVSGEVGRGYRPISKIEDCITNSLEKVDSQEFRMLGCKSILFPLLGTGTARGDLPEIAKKLIETTLSYLKNNRNSAINTIYFLTWTNIELKICQEIMRARSDLQREN